MKVLHDVFILQKKSAVNFPFLESISMLYITRFESGWYQVYFILNKLQHDAVQSRIQTVTFQTFMINIIFFIVTRYLDVKRFKRFLWSD